MAKFLRSILLVLVLALFVGAADSCQSASNEASQQQGKKTDQMQEEAFRQVGMPNIRNFQELKFMKRIIELRDKEVSTYTYTVDEQGRLHHLCQSLGYGLPYSTQMTSPEKPEFGWDDDNRNLGDYSLPQPEPNGLFMPENVAATWVLCYNAADDQVAPVYSEPELIVSPFRLKAVDEYPAESPRGADVSGGSGQ